MLKQCFFINHKNKQALQFRVLHTETHAIKFFLFVENKKVLMTFRLKLIWKENRRTFWSFLDKFKVNLQQYYLIVSETIFINFLYFLDLINYQPDYKISKDDFKLFFFHEKNKHFMQNIRLFKFIRIYSLLECNDTKKF